MPGTSRGPLLVLASVCLLPSILSCGPAVPEKAGVTGDEGLEAVLEDVRGEEGPAPHDSAAEYGAPEGRSVWEHAKLSGVDFRATGNEPGWYIEIRSDLEAREGKRILFVSDYGQEEAVLHAPDPEPGLRRTIYRGASGDLRIVVEIEGNACRDSMSGEQFESTVTVEFRGRTYSGCGRALH